MDPQETSGAGVEASRVQRGEAHDETREETSAAGRSVPSLMWLCSALPELTDEREYLLNV